MVCVLFLSFHCSNPKRSSSGQLENHPVESFVETVHRFSGRVLSNGCSFPCKFWTAQMLSRMVSMGDQIWPVVYAPSNVQRETMEDEWREEIKGKFVHWLRKLHTMIRKHDLMMN
jgi:hypothetical protein